MSRDPALCSASRMPLWLSGYCAGLERAGWMRSTFESQWDFWCRDVTVPWDFLQTHWKRELSCFATNTKWDMKYVFRNKFSEFAYSFLIFSDVETGRNRKLRNWSPVWRNIAQVFSGSTKERGGSHRRKQQAWLSVAASVADVAGGSARDVRAYVSHWQSLKCSVKNLKAFLQGLLNGFLSNTKYLLKWICLKGILKGIYS